MELSSFESLELPSKGIIATLYGSSEPLVISKNNSPKHNVGNNIMVNIKKLIFTVD